MIYLATPAGDFACCEQEASAVRLEARGYERITRELYIALWRRKDRRARAATRLPAVEQARAVGEPWRAPWILKDVPKK